MKMSFVTLKMSGNPTSPMFLFLPFPEGGEGAGASGSLVLGVDMCHFLSIRTVCCHGGYLWQEARMSVIRLQPLGH